MKKFIENMQRAANKFTAMDYACFKIYMLSIGVLFGVYFVPFFVTRLNIVWCVAILTGLFIIFRLFKNYRNN